MFLCSHQLPPTYDLSHLLLIWLGVTDLQELICHNIHPCLVPPCVGKVLCMVDRKVASCTAHMDQMDLKPCTWSLHYYWIRYVSPNIPSEVKYLRNDALGVIVSTTGVSLVAAAARTIQVLAVLQRCRRGVWMRLAALCAVLQFNATDVLLLAVKASMLLMLLILTKKNSKRNNDNTGTELLASSQQLECVGQKCHSPSHHRPCSMNKQGHKRCVCACEPLHAKPGCSRDGS